MHARRTPAAGFTLVELSIVIIILSIMLGGIMAVVTQEVRRTKQAELKTKLAAIEAALIQFRKVNNRIPCPADGLTLPNTANFGIEGINAGACTTGSTYNVNGNRTAVANPTANYYNSSYANVAGGVLPVATLGLPDEYMFDPWGGRFTYVVDRRATAANAFTTYDVSSTTIGAIRVNAASGIRTLSAIVVIVSHGENGHGAYQYSGVRKSIGSTHASELANCHCTSAGADGVFNTNTVPFVMQAAVSSGTNIANNFDDTVVYYTRSQITSSNDMVREYAP